MKESLEHIVIKTSETDNVGIIANFVGFKKDDILKNGITLMENVPMGHKVALSNLGEGDKIVRYGQTIGIAKTKIKAGEWVNEAKMTLPKTPVLSSPGFAIIPKNSY